MPDNDEIIAQKNQAKQKLGDAADAFVAAGDDRIEALTESRVKFNKALDEAKGSAKALGKELSEKGEVYRGKLVDKTAELKGTAKEKAATLAEDGKGRVSSGLSNLGKVVSENAGTIDEKLGSKYGDYARTAAQSIQDAAARVDAKDLTELGDDAIAFIRKSPGLAVGIAAVAGFMLARLFRGSDD